MFKNPTLFFFTALAIPFSCTSSSPPGENEEEIARQKKENLRQQVREFAATHDADLEWVTLLDLDPMEFYTIELQKALLEPAGRSRLLVAVVDDVFKRHDLTPLNRSKARVSKL